MKKLILATVSALALTTPASAQYFFAFQDAVHDRMYWGEPGGGTIGFGAPAYAWGTPMVAPSVTYAPGFTAYAAAPGFASCRIVRTRHVLPDGSILIRRHRAC